MIRRLRESRTPRPTQGHAPGPKSLGIFGLFLILPGLAIAFFLGVRPLRMVHRAQNWTATPAKVLASSVHTHRGTDSTTYSVHIEYVYEWNGVEYRSNRFGFASGSSSGYRQKAEIVRNFPPGHAFEAFVDPENPDQAVIHRGFQWRYLGTLGIGLLFTFSGLFLLLGGRRAARPGSRSDTQTFLPPLPRADARGIILLQPDLSPWRKALGMLVFALFWNAVVSVFVFQVWQSARSGSPNILLMLFLIPFVLIGVGTVFGFFYTLLAAFNPRLLLLLSPSWPQPGGSFTLDWEFQGNSDRLAGYSLVLEGLEQIQYTTGSGKHRSHHLREQLFYQQTLLQNHAPSRLSENTLTVALPADLPHSFHAPNNRIVWRIRLHGPIRFWPDLHQTFPLVVLPRTAF